MKLQNNFIKGKMNKELDERLVPNGEYRDALNIRVLNTSNSDTGGIENVEGNKRITNIGVTNNPECIGSVTDEANDRIYWFVVNDSGHSYVFEYDIREGVVTTVLEDERAAATQVLKFDKNYKINGANVVYNVSNRRYLLLFTDNLNPPRCINIERAKGYGLNGFEDEDISLYKKPPGKAISVTPYNTSNQSENAVKERFFAFAYRYKYLDGEYSALSSFTDYQFTPGRFEVDYETMVNKGMENSFNAYNLSFNTGDKRVTDIQLCFKNPNNPNVYIIDTINKTDYAYIDNVEKSYSFDNSKVYSILPEDEILRLFDNIPLTAKAQDFIENRLVFGNITDQYDLVETEGEDDYIKFNYSTSIESSDAVGSAVTTTRQTDGTTDNRELVIDFSAVSLSKGYLFYLGADIASDELGTSPNEYFGGTHTSDAYVVLTQTYLSAKDFQASDDFTQFLQTLNALFEENVTVNAQNGETFSAYGTYTAKARGSVTDDDQIILITPANTYTGTPSSEIFKWTQNAAVYVRESSSLASLKSNRGYDFGIVYLDKFGRYSSVIPTSNSTGSSSSEVFIPIKDSTSINKAKLTVNNKPPYWAEKYKFFIKTNKPPAHTIYATVFYVDNNYRWVYLNGDTVKKVEEGQSLIVKSDSRGPLQKEVKVKVLEVVQKTASDVIQSDDANSSKGWLAGNTGGAGQEINEIFGTFMKIKPVGFSMNFDEDSYFNYSQKNVVEDWSSANADVEIIPPAIKQVGILQEVNAVGDAYESYDITPGSQIVFDLTMEEKKGNGTPAYYNQWTASATYSNSTSPTGQSALEKFIVAETNWEYDTPGGFYTDPNGNYRFYFFTQTVSEYNAGANVRHRLRVESSQTTGFFDFGTITATVNFYLNPEGILVFETDPEENDTDIYYETSQVFDIENGLHKGNVQDQTSSVPAIVKLETGNCFSFANGVESMFIKDERFNNSIDLDLRPNGVLIDGYRRRVLNNTLIYSGPINPETTYNSINEFNASRGITKLMDQKYGSIQKLHARDNDLLVFQEDKVQKVLYGKSLLYASDGAASLQSIDDVLGQQVPFQGDFGISKNPESFASYGASVFFTDASRGMVLKLDNQGIEPISFVGMKSYFKNNLFEYKNKFNYGGYDPRNNEYVLSMNNDYSSGQVVPLELFKTYDCNSIFKKTMSDTTSYTYKVEFDEVGTLTFNHVIVGSVNISVTDPEQNVTTFNNRSGTGSFNFTIDQGQLDIANFYTITITANEDSEVEMAHSCPVNATREVVIYVITDIELVGQTIINKYRVNSGNDYGQLDVFSQTGVTRSESFTENVQTEYIPEDQDTITMTSLKQTGIHTATFNDDSSMGYLISSSEKTAFEVALEATYPATTFTQTLEAQTYEATFTFAETASTDKLYLIYNYGFAGVVEEEGGNDGETGSGSGGSGGIEQNACLDNVHTYYIGGALASVSALENGGPFNVSTQVKGESATIAGNENTTICQGTSEFTYAAPAYWIVLTSPNANFDPANGFNWWQISATGVVLSQGTSTGGTP
jgi:hypothetical protein